MTLRNVCSPGMGRWFVVCLCSAAFFPASSAWADSNSKEEISLSPVFEKAVPESIQDLQAIQRHVQSLLKKTMRATVGVKVGAAQGSGVIVNKEGIVLTAGHVSGIADRKCDIILPDGRILKGKTLGANHGIDSGMIQITDKGDFPFCELATSADLKPGDWCMAIGHPGGIQKGRNPVVRLGRVQMSSKTFIKTDCTLVGGDSGGPLFDMHGKVIGIHSRIGELITANIHVPVDTYRETWDRLAQGEEWGGSLFGSGRNRAFMGLTPDKESKNCRIDSVTAGSPADKAGLKPNDILRTFDGKRVGNWDDLTRLMAGKRPGNEVALEVLRGEDTYALRITLGKQTD